MYNTVKRTLNFNNREEIVNSKMFTIENKKTVLQQYDEIKATIEYLLPLAKKQVKTVNESTERQMRLSKSKYSQNFKLVTRLTPIRELGRILTEDALKIKYKRIKVGRNEVKLYLSSLTHLNGNYAYVPLKGAKKNSSGWKDNTKIYFLDLNKMVEEKVKVTTIKSENKNRAIEIVPYITTKGNSWSETQVLRVKHNEGCNDNWRRAFNNTYSSNSYSDKSRDYTNISTIFKKYNDMLSAYDYQNHRDKERIKQRNEAEKRATEMKLNESVTHKFIAEQMGVNEVDLNIKWKPNHGTGTFTLGEWDFECKLQMLCNETNCSDIITKISNLQPSNPFELVNQLTGGIH
jgi:hypothetical protein